MKGTVDTLDMLTRTDASWRSLHVYYDADPLHLITDCLRPLARRALADEAALSWFFLRYWDGGPHCRFRIKTYDEEVVDDLSTEISRYVESYPSPSLLDETSYTRYAFGLADLEGMTEWLPRVPNNSVVRATYSPEHDKYGRGQALSAVERHFHRCSEMSAALLERLSPTELNSVALLILYGVTRECAADCGGGRAETWRGHARERDLNRTFEQQLPTLRRLTELADQSVGSTFHRRWLASLNETSSFFDDALSACRMRSNAAHMLCNRVGISISEEIQLRYFTYRLLAKEA